MTIEEEGLRRSLGKIRASVRRSVNTPEFEGLRRASEKVANTFKVQSQLEIDRRENNMLRRWNSRQERADD